MTRRQARALIPRPAGRRARAGDRVLAVLGWISRGLDRLDARMGASTRWLDRPGPSSDDIEMQPELPDVAR